MGNRRFRQLVRDSQAEYLVARRKSKPAIARRIVRTVRERGGRFLKRHEGTGFLFEVGDERAESKTSQALREGLDVRAGNRKRREREEDYAAHIDTDKKRRTEDEDNGVPEGRADAELGRDDGERERPNDGDYPEMWSAV